MGKRTEYKPGTFSWVDLGTTDADGAKRFYGELLGWEADDMDAGEGRVYSMLKLDGDYVCALYEQDARMREQGVPPNWLSYVTVEDADAAATKARELGGTVQMGPFDVLDVGRMAVVQDPTGAVFALWQPKQHIGAGRVNDVGCLTWNQLTTPDTDAATAFYKGLFGWDAEIIDTGGGPPYISIRNGGRLNGGMMAPPPGQEGIPPHWLPYFTVPSTDGAVERVGQLGGRTVAGPMDVPAGRFAICTDPQGAAFAVFEGDTED